MVGGLSLSQWVTVILWKSFRNPARTHQLRLAACEFTGFGISGWWLNQPPWKIFVKMGIIPKVRGENTKVRGEHKKIFELPPPRYTSQTLLWPWDFSAINSSPYLVIAPSQLSLGPLLDSLPIDNPVSRLEWEKWVDFHVPFELWCVWFLVI